MTLATYLRKLVNLAGPPLSTVGSTFEPPQDIGPIGAELRELLAERNGFYVFESAMLVRPSCSCKDTREATVEEWNDPSLWIDAYSGLAAKCFFFAEDVFGTQFCLSAGGVFTFDPETGERSLIARTLEGWAEQIMRDYEALTGHPLARAWQEQHGPLPPRKRLIPKIPFVLNGDFDLSNLYLADSVEAMRARASIAQQIHDLPDGASVKLVLED